MKIFYLIFFTPFFSFASVQKYDLQLSYAVYEGQPVNQRIVLKEGKTLILKGKEHFLEVVAQEGKINDRKGILLSFNVGEVRENGKRSILTQPKLLVKDNEEAAITIDDVALKVTASRKK
jgi:type II secretory pathway component GspD/PulD (secretin)